MKKFMKSVMGMMLFMSSFTFVKADDTKDVFEGTDTIIHNFSKIER